MTSNSTKSTSALNNLFFEGDLAKLHKPGENPQINSNLMKEHLSRTNSQVLTRFPPEPNGFLHIGHAKAINVNFGYAQSRKGSCLLRYDDTNPEAEEEIYFSSILQDVKWLGFSPSRITYSSDYFDKLYELAISLIKKGHAYVCFCSGEEINKQRGGKDKGPRYRCSHSESSVEETLDSFAKMKKGYFKENEATLRMKMDITSGNPQFWDLVAYRVLMTPHHRTKDKWCIYPTYDFTHCLVDSIEDITHSLCTTEFRQSRESYYWLCDKVEVYKPVQWEYGRLNITNTVLSKRKLNKLVTLKLVDGWDDPRLFTIKALRRRGVPKDAINRFVLSVGVTTANTTIDVKKFDKEIRDELNVTTWRLMALMKPVLLVLENLSEDYEETITLPNKPRDTSFGERKVVFTKYIYIDADDFRTKDEPKYFRLAPGKSVGLLNVPFPITCTRFEMDDQTNEVKTIFCKYLNDTTVKTKVKAYIQWVARSEKHSSPVKIDRVNIYSNLFMHANPLDSKLGEDGWLKDINNSSLKSIESAVIETGINDLIKHVIATQEHNEEIGMEQIKSQFIRIGFYCVDAASSFKDLKKGYQSGDKLVFNQVVSLREDSDK